MTTIAFRERILAADTEVSSTAMAWATTSKIFGTHMAMAGVTGGIADLATFQAWFARACIEWTTEGNLPTRAFIDFGPEAKKPDECEAILVLANGRVYSWQGTPILKSIGLCRTSLGGLLPDDQPGFVSIGSGERFAMAAMACGLPAEAAVTLACRLQGFSVMQRVETLSFQFIESQVGKNAIYGLDAPDTRPVIPAPTAEQDPPYPFPPRPETIQ